MAGALALAAFLLAAGLPAALPGSAAAGSDPDPLFEGFEMLPADSVPVTRSSEPLAIVASFLALPGLSGEQVSAARELLSLTVRAEGGDLLVDAALRGYLDDSLLGENFRARIVRDGGQWRLRALGRQGVCARGEKAGQPAPICP